MPQINSISNLLPNGGAGIQIPFDVRQRMLAGQLATEQAAAPKAPYSSRAAGMVSALTGGLGGLVEGMQVQRTMQGQRDSAAHVMALANALGQPTPGGPPTAPNNAPSSAGPTPSPALQNPSAPVGQGGAGSDAVAGKGHTDFLTSVMPQAQRVAAQTGLDPRLVAAQAALESNYGRSAPGGNLFGIKGAGTGPISTTESVNGQMVPTKASFASYDSPGASFDGYGKLMMGDRYAGVRNAQGLDAQLAALGKSGYATDPDYAAKVGSIARGLQLPDAPAASGGQAAAADMPAPNAQPSGATSLPPGITPDMVSAPPADPSLRQTIEAAATEHDPNTGNPMVSPQPASPVGGGSLGTDTNYMLRGADPSRVAPTPDPGASPAMVAALMNPTPLADQGSGGMGGPGSGTGVLTGSDGPASPMDTGSLLPSTAPMPPPGAQSQPDSAALATALMAPSPGSGAALPQTGPMPPPGAQSLADAGPSPDAPAPTASQAGPAPMPSMDPQPMGVVGNSAMADPSSPQSFQRQQALASALGSRDDGSQPPAQNPGMMASMLGGGGGSPSPAPNPSSPPSSDSGIGGLLGGLFGGSGSGQQPASASVDPAQGGAGPMHGGQQDPRAAMQTILADPYAPDSVKSMVMQRLFPTMQIEKGADGGVYGVNPTTGQFHKLGDTGAVLKQNESMLQNGRFTQAPAGPMDAAPGHSVMTFGANNQPSGNTPIAPEPSMTPIPGTGLMGDKSGNTAPIPGGVNGTATMKAGAVDVPLTTNIGPNGVTAAPLLSGGGAGAGGGPLGAVAPIAEQAAKMDASAAAQKEGAVGQVKGAQTFVDEAAKNASAAATHVNELQQLKSLAANSPTGWSAEASRYAAEHGWVTPNGDKVQSYDGFRAYLGTQLRQAGSGALRNAEMDKLSDTLGNTNMDPATRAAAIQRVQDGFARQAALGQVASDPGAADPVAKQSRIQDVQQTWQNADAAIEAHPDKKAAIIGKLQAHGYPVVGF